MNKNNKLIKQKAIVFSIIIILVAGGYFLYQYYQKKTAAEFAVEEKISEFENKIPLQCENGEWTEFPDYAQAGNFPEFKGNATLKMKDAENFTDADGADFFTTDENYSLAFFADKAVRIEGLNISSSSKKEIYVKRIKCVGKEADPEIQSQRQNLMKYLSANINSLALEKSAVDAWQINTFYFVNDNDIYVEYESLGSVGGDEPYDGRLWLIRATKLERTIPAIETLAYIREDAKDPSKNILKQGTDLYKDATGMAVYELNDDATRWVMQ
ncbi:MAG: hypothetical protein WCX17_01195 [Parcubacteria group bacterium]|jgi:hypothetical protein